MGSIKLNATMKEEMVSRIDKYCASAGMSRSAFLAMASTQYLDAVEKKPIISDAFGNVGDLLKLALSGKADSPEYAATLAALQTAGDALKKQSPAAGTREGSHMKGYGDCIA